MRKILKTKVYHDGRSMVVLNVGDKHDVPERLVQAWIDEGVIAGKTSKEVAIEKAAQIAADEADHEEPTAFTKRSIPGGRFVIEGPGGFKETVKKTDVDARLAVLNTQAALDVEGDDGTTNDADDGDAGDGDDTDAPV